MKKVCRDRFQDGAIVLTFIAFILPLLLFGLMIASDVLRLVLDRYRVQQVVDEAALLALPHLSSKLEVEAAVQAYLLSGIGDNYSYALRINSPQIEIDLNRKLSLPFYSLIKRLLSSEVAVDFEYRINARAGLTPINVILAIDAHESILANEETSQQELPFFNRLRKTVSGHVPSRLTDRCFHPGLQQSKGFLLNAFKHFRKLKRYYPVALYLPEKHDEAFLVNHPDGTIDPLFIFSELYSPSDVKGSWCAAAALASDSGNSYSMPEKVRKHFDISGLFTADFSYSGEAFYRLPPEAFVWAHPVVKGNPSKFTHFISQIAPTISRLKQPELPVVALFVSTRSPASEAGGYSSAYHALNNWLEQRNLKVRMKYIHLKSDGMMALEIKERLYAGVNLSVDLLPVSSSARSETIINLLLSHSEVPHMEY